MARKVEESVSCDFPGCRKSPGAAQNDHITLTVSHEYAAGRDPDVPGMTGSALDFCSWKHASEYLTTVMGPQREDELKQRQAAPAAEAEDDE